MIIFENNAKSKHKQSRFIELYYPRILKNSFEKFFNVYLNTLKILNEELMPSSLFEVTVLKETSNAWNRNAQQS